MRRHKSFLVPAVFVFSLFCMPLYAQSFSVQWGSSFPIKGDVRNCAPAEDFIVAADVGDFHFDSGLKYQCDQLDFTNRAFFMPTFFDTFQAGFGINYHLYRCFKTFTENDLIVSTRFAWVRGSVFSCELAPGLLFKFATIDAVKKSKPFIFNLSYSFELLCRWQLSHTGLWCGLNLQDYFDYPLAISPFFKLGADYAVNPDLILGTDFTLKFVDMFYSAIYMNEAVLRFTVKVML